VENGKDGLALVAAVPTSDQVGLSGHPEPPFGEKLVKKQEQSQCVNDHGELL